MHWTGLAADETERIWRAARALAPDEETAWDCVQDAFATALARATAPRDPVAWLCGVARNHARHRSRARSRWTAMLERLRARRRRAAHREPPLDLQDALKRLPMRNRDAVTLRYLAGMSHAEVAEAQGISEAAAKARVRRGLARLRHLLGGAALAALLARKAAAADRTAIRAAAAAAAAPIGGIVVKKWTVFATVLVALAGTGVAWRSLRESAAGPRTNGSLPDVSAPSVADAERESERRPAAPEAGDAPAPGRYPAHREVVALHVRVEDHLGEPVPHAKVTIAPDRGGMLPELAIRDDRIGGSRTSACDESGRLEARVPEGPYRIACRGTERTVAVGASGTPVVLRLPERPESRGLVVLVRDAAGASVAGAEVEVVAGARGRGIVTRTLTSGDEGTCRIEGLPISAAAVRARAPGGRVGMATMRQPTSYARARVTVTVAGAGSLEGRLTGVEDELLEGATVRAHALTVQAPYWGVVGFTPRTAPVAGGRYRFDSLPAGTYALTLDAPAGARLVTERMRWGRTPLENSVQPILAKVEAGARTTHDLAVAAGAAIEGVVRRPGDAPVAGALVKVTYAPYTGNFPDGFVLHGCNVWRLDSDLETWADHPSSHWSARTDAAGRYRFASLPPGRHRVEVFFDGLSFDRRENVTVEAGGTAALEHELVDAGVLQVAVNGVSYFGLVPDGEEQPLLIAIVSGRKAFTLPGLPPGKYRAAAFHSDPSIGVLAELGETEVLAGRTAWWDLRAEARYRIRGHVLSPGGPVAGVRLRSYGAEPTQSDARGAFELRSNARYRDAVLVVVHDGRLQRHVTVQTGGAEDVTSDIVLGGHALMVRTKDAGDEDTAADLTVSALEGDSELRPSTVRTAGVVTLPHLRRARYRVRAGFRGGAVVTEDVDVPESRAVTLLEPPTGRLELRIAGVREPMAVHAYARVPDRPRNDTEASLGGKTAEADAGGTVVLDRFPAGRIEIGLGRKQVYGGRVRFRVAHGPIVTSHEVDLAAGETLRLRITVVP